jgi:hypothetical protein
MFWCTARNRAFTTPAPTSGAAARAVHILNFRNGLDPARAALSLPAQVYTEPVLTSSSIKAVHINEVRSGVR